jgi:hypothetical protein
MIVATIEDTEITLLWGDSATFILQRERQDAYGTHGAMFRDGVEVCRTLEEPWRDNQPKVSCIPPGVYKCAPHNGFHFRDVWKVENVPGRSAILIHAGNTLDDTEGCILVGLKSVDTGVALSRLAMNKLREILPDNFILEVRPCPA